MANIKKYNLFAKIKPYDLKLSLVFSADSRIRYVQEFIEDTMRNYRTKYRVGRIEQEKTSSILLPDFKIGEVLDDKDNIIVYSIEYGLTKKTLNDQSSIEDIDKLFIGKKIKRDSRNISQNESIDKKIPKKEEEENDNDVEEDKNDEEEEEEDEDENDKNKEQKNDEKNEKYVQNEKNAKIVEKNAKIGNKKETKKTPNKSNKKKKVALNESSSGDDKSQDLKI